MIDAPSPVVRKSVTEIVPISVLHPFEVEPPKHIMESPADRVTIGFARLDVEVRIVDAAIRVVDVDRFRRDIQITEPNGRLHRIEPLAEITADAMKPLQLEDVFVGPDSESLRDIGVDDREAIDYSLKDSDIFAVRPCAEAMHHGFGFATAEGSDAVIPLHAAEG